MSNSINIKGHIIKSYTNIEYGPRVYGSNYIVEKRLNQSLNIIRGVFNFKARIFKEGVVGYAQYLHNNDVYIGMGEYITPYGRPTLHIHILVLDMSEYEKIGCNIFNIINQFIKYRDFLKKLKEIEKRKLNWELKPDFSSKRFASDIEETVRSIINGWLSGTRKFYVDDPNISFQIMRKIINIIGQRISFSVNLAPENEHYFDLIILGTRGPKITSKPQPLTDVLLSDRKEVVYELNKCVGLKFSKLVREINKYLNEKIDIEEALIEIIKNKPEINVNFEELWEFFNKRSPNRAYNLYNEILKIKEIKPEMLKSDIKLKYVIENIYESRGIITGLRPLYDLLLYYEYMYSRRISKEVVKILPVKDRKKSIIQILKDKGYEEAIKYFEKDKIINIIYNDHSLLENPLNMTSDVCEDSKILKEGLCLKYFFEILKKHNYEELERMIVEGEFSPVYPLKTVRKSSSKFKKYIEDYLNSDLNSDLFIERLSKLLWILLKTKKEDLGDKTIKEITSTIKRAVWNVWNKREFDIHIFFKRLSFKGLGVAIPAQLWLQWLGRNEKEYSNVKKNIVKALFR